MSDAPLRIVLVDDDRMWLSLTSALADKDEGVELVGRSSTGAETMQVVAQEQPDLVLLDLAMPDVDGLTMLPNLLKVAPGCRIVMVTGNDYAPLRQMAKEAGAIGLLPKEPLASLFDRLRDLLATVDA